jgi:hypothetical protein
MVVGTRVERCQEGRSVCRAWLGGTPDLLPSGNLVPTCSSHGMNENSEAQGGNSERHGRSSGFAQRVVNVPKQLPFRRDLRPSDGCANASIRLSRCRSERTICPDAECRTDPDLSFLSRHDATVLSRGHARPELSTSLPGAERYAGGKPARKSRPCAPRPSNVGLTPPGSQACASA